MVIQSSKYEEMLIHKNQHPQSSKQCCLHKNQHMQNHRNQQKSKVFICMRRCKIIGMGVCWALKMPAFPSYFSTTSKSYFHTLPYFIAIFLQTITKYLLYALWLVITVFSCFNVLKMILLSFPNDGFISFTKLQEFLEAATYRLGTGIP